MASREFFERSEWKYDMAMDDYHNASGQRLTREQYNNFCKGVAINKGELGMDDPPAPKLPEPVLPPPTPPRRARVIGEMTATNIVDDVARYYQGATEVMRFAEHVKDNLRSAASEVTLATSSEVRDPKELAR
jgi:hypothetical protein